MPDPAFFRAYVGSTLADRHAAPIFSIGRFHFSRSAIVSTLGCSATPRTVKILATALESLEVKTVRDALKINPVDLADLPNVGVTTLYLFLCWQRYAREENDRELAEWYGEPVTFGTLKARVRKRKAREAEPVASTNGKRR